MRCAAESIFCGSQRYEYSLIVNRTANPRQHVTCPSVAEAREGQLVGSVKCNVTLLALGVTDCLTKRGKVPKGGRGEPMGRGEPAYFTYIVAEIVDCHAAASQMANRPTENAFFDITSTY